MFFFFFETFDDNKQTNKMANQIKTEYRKFCWKIVFFWLVHPTLHSYTVNIHSHTHIGCVQQFCFSTCKI